jgi:hypothetical protein
MSGVLRSGDGPFIRTVARNRLRGVRRPRRAGLERGLDGGGDEPRGLRVYDDVPAEQHTADNLPGMRGRVVRADGGGLGHTRTVEETSVRRVLSSGAGEFLVPMGMSC